MFHRYLYPVILFCVFIPNFSMLMAGEVHEFTLENGLRLIVKEDHRAPVVVSQVWYKVGSSYEQEGKTGLSHLLEHMMFKGTEKYGPGEFSRIMAENGANDNAFTSDDYTAYFQTLEKSRLPISFELEADRMRNLRLQESEFVKEKQVVLEERRTRTEDKPVSLLYEYFAATAHQTSPYKNPTIGWMNDVKNLTLTDLQTWYDRWYAPNNATVVVVGDVNPQAVLVLAKQHFGVLKPSEIALPVARPEVEQYGIKRLTVKRPAKLPHLVMGYKAPALRNLSDTDKWEGYALEVLAAVLDGGDSARFSKNLVRGQQIATSASASYSSFSRLDDLFTLSGVPTDTHTVAELEQALREQIQQVQTTLVEKAELERVKTQVRAGKVYELDSMFYQGMQIGSLVAMGFDWHLADSYAENIATVTPEQVQAVARKYLIDDHLTMGILEPQPLPEGKTIRTETTPSGSVH
ncbi:MAG: peptidase M16 [Beggiatoa sp. IS2]|nr:MAG: peptidase M16 [Beggiatoa sp. IS2]